MSKAVAESAAKQGFIEKAEMEAMDEESAKKTAGFEALSWAWNSRGKARRFREVLGWKPREVGIEEEVPKIVRQEFERLQQEKK